MEPPRKETILEFLTTSDVEEVFTTLSRAETLNKSIHSFFNLIGTEINGADLKGCSARVTGDEEAITVTTLMQTSSVLPITSATATSYPRASRSLSFALE